MKRDFLEINEPNPKRTKPLDPERYAPAGHIWQCYACGKISPYDRYGDEKSSPGWDASCVLNSRLIADHGI